MTDDLSRTDPDELAPTPSPLVDVPDVDVFTDPDDEAEPPADEDVGE